MTEYKKPLFSLAILDFKRESEARKLFESLDVNLKCKPEIIYCHDGYPGDYVYELYEAGKIDTLLLSNKSLGCGIRTRQLFQTALSDWVLYCQVDQILLGQINEELVGKIISTLNNRPEYLYVDMAGNQGHGNYSERAHFINKHRYLSIPDIDNIIGGPGPFADHKWTERHVQDYMKANGLFFIPGFFFGDNGKWSIRRYPCGGLTKHATDEKTLFILEPLKQRYDFPNLKLTDAEWEEVLSGKWPKEGKIPQNDKLHSFLVWK